MSTHARIGGICILVACAGARAQSVPETREYARRGELSPGTEAPTPAAMVQAIEGGSVERFATTLEYGERVHCPACVPRLERRMLESPEPRVRTLSAWWLRRQPFAAAGVGSRLRLRLASEVDPSARARIVAALGELMDPSAFELLVARAQGDGDAGVRAAAVRALARLNDPRAGAAISRALGDAAPEVKQSALDAHLGVSGFRDLAPLVALLGDDDPALRAQAATLCGEYRVTAAEAPLAAMLRGDTAARARKAAAWALGRIGTGTARVVLGERAAVETDGLVKSALAVALRMPARAP